jgi:hypothetical protein
MPPFILSLPRCFVRDAPFWQSVGDLAPQLAFSAAALRIAARITR